MAGVMRVLFSHSRKSAGLVFQLGGRKILLNSTCPSFPVVPLKFCGLVDLVFRQNQTKGEAIAPLNGYSVDGHHFIATEFALFPTPQLPPQDPPRGTAPHQVHPLRVYHWLNQLIFVFTKGSKLTREQLFERAANQDGAAHVDLQLDQDYERLQLVGGLNFSFSWSAQGPLMVVKDVHLPALRQMSHELLTSAELRALAETPP